MSLGGVIAGGVALKVLYDALSDTDADHDEVLQDVYENVESEVAPRTSVFVDHLDVAADGNPRAAKPGNEHIPDLAVSGFADRNLVVEVETGDTLDSTAISQLEDFATPGYTRVMVVPDVAVDDGTAFLKEWSSDAAGKVVVCGPSDITDLL